MLSKFWEITDLLAAEAWKQHTSLENGITNSGVGVILCVYMEVSTVMGVPLTMDGFCNGQTYEQGWFRGTPILENHHIIMFRKLGPSRILHDLTWEGHNVGGIIQMFLDQNILIVCSVLEFGATKRVIPGSAASFFCYSMAWPIPSFLRDVWWYRTPVIKSGNRKSLIHQGFNRETNYKWEISIAMLDSQRVYLRLFIHGSRLVAVFQSVKTTPGGFV